MKTIAATMTIVISILLAANMSALDQDDFAQRFDAALATALSKAASQRDDRRLQHSGLQEWVALTEQAQNLAKAADIPFLRVTMADKQRTSAANALAALTLAHLAETDAKAFEVLAAEACASNFTAILAFSGASIDGARQLAERLLTDGKTTWDRFSAANLLAGVGDADSLELLKKATPAEARNEDFDELMPGVIAELQQLLEQVPETEREDYRKMHLNFWLMQEKRDDPANDRLRLWWEWYKAVDGALAGMRFTSGFLAMKIAPEKFPGPRWQPSHKQSLAAAIAGQQKETTLIPDLGRMASDNISASTALYHMATDESLLVWLKTCVSPEEMPLLHLGDGHLSKHGGLECAAELQRLAANSDYAERFRKFFAETALVIMEREQKKEAEINKIGD